LVLWFWFCRRRGGGIGGPGDFGVLRDYGRRSGETGKKRMKLLAFGGGGCFELEFWSWGALELWSSSWERARERHY
jgi:hypothetical protein